MAVRLETEYGVIVDKLAVCPQDAVVLILMLEGITAEEIAELTRGQIDEGTRMLSLPQRKGGIRYHPVSKICIQLLQQALQQTSYPAKLPDGSAYELKLEPSEYVIKLSLWDHVGQEAFIQDPASVRLRTVYTRLRKLTELDPKLNLPMASSTDIDLVS
ncbi:hypothetical protein ACFFK0_01670 [Paenibacillus chartarius]|uniref:Tyr recombinase domain-containing protein n=1 Tax=Paenibacillus chartarius TaxID=747481 RepID=A0ABV6DET7_9BACL